MQVALGIAAMPSLFGMIFFRVAFHQLENLGVNSEEIFRGERLPVLPFPDKT
jgi:hypothetical protein